MTSPNQKSSKTTPLPTSTSQFPTEFLLSLATGSLLLGIVGAKATYSLIEELGKASEEVFRGDRLPMLNFPDSHCEE
ncbi:MAG: hypothetical protein KME06_09055 [Kastovskya adunca ATA6-11-RM4]|jgi:hypothetical protein|nr:hypothetical protein [Kastovskya adunca ATA6-11-RM4]